MRVKKLAGDPANCEDIFMSKAPVMNIVVQLVDQKTGVRTPPVTKTREEFANALAELVPESQHEKLFVLVLADDSVKPGSLDFALAPLMTVSSFIKHFSTFQMKKE